MAKLSILAGTTSDSELIFIQDSSSTTGAGRSGLAFNTTGLSATYAFATKTPVTITFATLTAVTAAFSSGGFIELNASIMTGWYRFDIPDAALAAGNGRRVALHFFGAASMAPLPAEIELTGWDNQKAFQNQTIAAVVAAVSASVTAMSANISGNQTVAAVAGTVTALLANSASHGGTAFVLTGERLVFASTITNEPAWKITGNGTGNGLLITPGVNGNGLQIVGGVSAGSAIAISNTLGNAINIATGSGGLGTVGLNIDSVNVVTITVGGPTNFAGAVTAVNASNSITGVIVSGVSVGPVTVVAISANIMGSQTIAAVAAPVSIGNVTVGAMTANIMGNQTIAVVAGSVGSVAAVVPANIVQVNSIAVHGSGTSVSPWGP